VADRSTNSDLFFAPRWKKFDLDLRAQGQIGDGKHAHPNVTEIDAKSIHGCRAGEYLHGGVQKSALLSPPIWFEDAFENHPGPVRTR